MAWMPGFLMLSAGDSQPFPGDAPVQKLINTVSFSLGKKHVQGTLKYLPEIGGAYTPRTLAHGPWLWRTGGGCLACTDAMSLPFPAGGLQLHFNHSLYQRGVGEAGHLARTVWPSENKTKQKPKFYQTMEKTHLQKPYYVIILVQSPGTL